MLFVVILYRRWIILESRGGRHGRRAKKRATSKRRDHKRFEIKVSLYGTTIVQERQRGGHIEAKSADYEQQESVARQDFTQESFCHTRSEIIVENYKLQRKLLIFIKVKELDIIMHN